MTVTKAIIMLILATFVGLFGLSSFAETGKAIEVPIGNIKLVPNPISTCPQYCSCDNQGNVLYCAVPAVPLPTPQPVPAASEPVPSLKSYPEPLPATSGAVPAGKAKPASLMLPAGSAWSTIGPVKVEATPTKTVVVTPQKILGPLSAGCVQQGESVVCPATAVTQIVVPVATGQPSGKALEAVTIQAQPSEKTIAVSTQAVTAVTVEQVTIDGNQLYLGAPGVAQPVNILPHQVPGIVQAQAMVTAVETIELKTKAETPVYAVSGVERARLLGIIPVNVAVKTEVNAASGEITSVQKPWWSFLAF